MHLPDSIPDSVQVGFFVTVGFEKLCPKAFVALVSVWPHFEQLRFSSPCVVQPAALLVFQSLKLWPVAGIE